MAQRLGFDVQVLEEEWGTGVKPEKIEEILRADKDHKIKAVTACHNETATGVTSDIAAVRKAIDAAGHPALLYVDTVSSLASLDFRQDEWGVDLAISGFAKGSDASGRPQHSQRKPEGGRRVQDGEVEALLFRL